MALIIEKRETTLLVNKPAGIPVFPKKDSVEDSVLLRLFKFEPYRSQVVWPQGFEGGIVHRLDTPTSGGLLVAKNPQQVWKLRESFSQKRLEKRYLFLSAKEPKWDRHYCDAPLAHDKKKKGNMIPKRGNNTPHRGKWYNAKTTFRHLGRDEGVSLWEAVMFSGVMHQIRVHAAFLGIALLGDRRYGGGEKPEYFPSSFALHHQQISDWPKIVPPSWWPSWTHQKLEIER